MEIIEVKQNWPADTIRIDVSLGNYCNYKCWYCWPGSNDGTHKFPDFDLIVKNLSALLDYYLANSNKTKFDFNLLGGEATLWPRFVEFVAYFKSRYNCIFWYIIMGNSNYRPPPLCVHRPGLYGKSGVRSGADHLTPSMFVGKS